MRALVTGGAGFIGSNLVDALRGARRRGDACSTTSRRAGARTSTPAPRCHEADVADADAVGRAAGDTGPRWSSTSPRRSTSAARSPTRRSTRASTSSGTLVVLEAARAPRRPRVVFSSTGGAIYGETDGVPDARGRPAPAAGALRRRARPRPRTTCALYAPAARRPTWSPCATPTSTARARTRSARAASWPSSAERAPPRRAGRRCSATAARRATSSTSATWWPPTSRRRRTRTRPAPTTSGAARRRRSSRWPTCSGSRSSTGPSAAARCAAAPGPGARPPRAGLGGRSRHGRGPRAHPALGALPLSRARRRRRRVLPPPRRPRGRGVGPPPGPRRARRRRRRAGARAAPPGAAEARVRAPRRRRPDRPAAPAAVRDPRRRPRDLRARSSRPPFGRDAYAGWGAWAAPTLALALRALRRRFRFDLVHAHYAVPAADAVLRARLATPLVVSVHGGDVLWVARALRARARGGHARTDRGRARAGQLGRDRRPVAGAGRPRHARRAPGHRPARAAGAAPRRADARHRRPPGRAQAPRRRAAGAGRAARRALRDRRRRPRARPPRGGWRASSGVAERVDVRRRAAPRARAGRARGARTRSCCRAWTRPSASPTSRRWRAGSRPSGCAARTAPRRSRPPAAGSRWPSPAACARAIEATLAGRDGARARRARDRRSAASPGSGRRRDTVAAYAEAVARR